MTPKLDKVMFQIDSPNGKVWIDIAKIVSVGEVADGKRCLIWLEGMGGNYLSCTSYSATRLLQKMAVYGCRSSAVGS